MDYTAAEVIWAVRHEMARTVEDVLARRLRALFLDARAAVDMAPKVAALMGRRAKERLELGKYPGYRFYLCSRRIFANWFIIYN